MSVATSDSNHASGAGEAAPPPLIAALMDPRRFPRATHPVKLIETHISWVLLAGDFAYKIKKPLALGFLDFSTLPARHNCCEAELRLNRRTAPQMYLDVVPITGTAAAPVLGGDGAAIEYALKMRRFPQSALLDRIAGQGAFDARLADRLSDTVARFHADIAVAGAADDHGSPAQVTAPALENFDQLGRLDPPAGEASRLPALRDWTAAEGARLRQAFAARKSGGFVRECHGDLHLGNIAVLDGNPTLFDCIEFNPELRWIDVASEIAFMVTDLLDRGLMSLAWRCLNRYLEATGDYAGVDVLRYYLVYRLMVRAKVALIRARQGIHGAARRDAEAAYLRHARLAEQLIAPPRPALLLMHGVSGSGKTSVAQVLLEAFGAVRVRSDVERKRLHGLAAAQTSHSPVGGGLYDAAASQATYARLRQVAERVLRAGWPVVIDAASLQRADRDTFRRLAQSLDVPFELVSCNARVATLRDRLARRGTGGGDASEATAAVLERQLATQQAPEGAELAAAVVIGESADDLRDVVARVAARLDPGA